MKNLRLLALATGALVVPTGFLLGACSSDDTVITPDSGTDAQVDSPGPDVQVDTGPGDAGPDAFDGGYKVDTFAAQVAEEMCGSLTRCCFGNANVPDGGAVDGGTFNKEQCVRVYKAVGFESSLQGESAAADENLEVDQVAAADCLSKIDALMCNLTGASLQEIRTACFAAIKGKLGNGQPCRASIECQKGHFCLPSADAGAADGGVVGACAPLRAQGQSCDIYQGGSDEEDSVRDEQACSWRGSGDTNLRCASYDFVNDQYKPRNQWTCEPTVANNQGCNSTVWCAQGICNPDNNYVCESPIEYFNQFSCEAVVNP